LDIGNFVSTPGDTHLPLQANQGPDDVALPPSVPYRKAVGCLMYAKVLTRPNIALVIGRVAKFATQPRHSHWTAVQRIFRYLSGTIDMSISYCGSPHNLRLLITLHYAGIVMQITPVTTTT
jgi:hypothetical protein